MLQIYAPQYVKIGQIYEDYLHGSRAVATSPDAMPDQSQYNSLLETFRDLRRMCKETHLDVSARTLERTIQEFESFIRWAGV